MRKILILFLISIFLFSFFNVYAEDIVVWEAQLVAKKAEISGIEGAITELGKANYNIMEKRIE